MDEIFDIEHFEMIIENILEVEKDIIALRDFRSRLVESAIKEDRNLDEFEICFLNYLEQTIRNKNDKLDIILKHIRAEGSRD